MSIDDLLSDFVLVIVTENKSDKKLIYAVPSITNFHREKKTKPKRRIATELW